MYTHAVAKDLEESWQSVSIMCTGWGAVCQHFRPTGASSTQQSQHDTKEFSMENSSRNTTNALELHLDNMHRCQVQQNCLSDMY